MRHRLQGYVAGSEPDLAPELANAFDLDAWREATPLRFFGAGLEVTAGDLCVALVHLRPDGSEETLARLDQTGPGMAFSPPLHLPDLAGLLLPRIERIAEGTAFDFYFGTDDPARTPHLRVGLLLESGSAAENQALAEAFGALAPANGGDELHPVLFAAAPAPEGAGIPVLTGDTSPGRRLYEAAYGALAARDFTHVCLGAAGPVPAGGHAEGLARLAAFLRFAHLGRRIAAPALAEGQLRFGHRLAAPAEAADPHLALAADAPQVATASATSGARQPDYRADPAGWSALALRDLHAAGLPAPGQDMAHDLRLAAAGIVTTCPLSLWQPRPADPRPGGAAAIEARWRALARAGRLGDPETLARDFGAAVTGAIDADPATARDLLAAMAALLATPARPALPVPAPGAPPEELVRALARTAAALPRRLPARAAAEAGAEQRESAISAWARRLAPDALPGPDAQDRALAAAHLKLERLRDEMHLALRDQEVRMRALLQRNRLDDPVRTHADQDRASQLALALLKNRHAGQRAVIVGNGPSLAISDLERLGDAVTFASNKIYLAFEQTSWRPDYYSVEDSLVIQNNRERIAALTGTIKIFPDNMRLFGYHSADTVFAPFIGPKSFDDPLSDPDFPGFSDDLQVGLCWGSTIVYSQIQIALFLGCTEIVLIGLDHSYQLPSVRRDQYYLHEGEQNHFHPEYRTMGEKWNQPNLEVLEVSYARARDACAARGVRVLNASRQSALDIFERAGFDSLFPPRGEP